MTDQNNKMPGATKDQTNLSCQITDWIKALMPTIAALFVILGLQVHATKAQVANDGFTSITHEINTALFGGRYCQILKDSRSTTVGIWPFDEENIPVSPSSARRIYNNILHQLVELKPSCVDYLDGDGFSDLVKDSNRNGELQDGAISLREMFAKIQQSVDIIITPTIQQQDKHPYLSLKAVERKTIKTLAQTDWTLIPKSQLSTGLSDSALGLDATISKAARYLVNYAHGMVELRPRGIYFEASGAQPPIGRYLLDRLSGAIVQEYSNVLTKKTLRVRSMRALFAAKRGLTIAARELDPLVEKASLGTDSKSYELTGNYWVLDGAVEIKIGLRNDDHDTISWHGRIRIEDLPDLELRPKNNSLPSHEVIQVDPAFQITSPRAENPVYHPGEELTVLMRLDRPSWLYCFYVSADGKVVQLLPNQFQKGKQHGRYFDAGILHELPNPKLDPFIYRITATTRGEEVFRCFSAIRNITAELVPELRGNNFDPIPLSLAIRLGERFRRIKNAAISEASLTVTVE